VRAPSIAPVLQKIRVRRSLARAPAVQHRQYQYPV